MGIGGGEGVSEENITFYQIYLHKLKCRQFTTEQWVSEQAHVHGELYAFADMSPVGSLGTHHKEEKQNPFHSFWPT